MAKHPLHILELARKGAEVRYQELQAEITVLVRQFPHLRKANASVGKTGRLKPGKETPFEASKPRRKRSKMSAAAKKAVSLRMKKYWAGRRAAQAKK